ncbi:MAG: arginase family protein [Gemmatimonadota bacterium]
MITDRIRADDGGTCAVALVGLPFDGAIPTRPGARHGPAALRAALARFAADAGSRGWPEAVTVSDLGDLPLDGQGVAAVHRQVAQSLEGILGRIGWLLAVGGDHSLTFPVFQALAAARGGAWGLVTLDAHHDVRPYTLDRITSGTPFRRCLELGPDVLPPARLVQIGLRPHANALEHRTWCEERGVALYDVEDVRARGAAAVAVEALARAGDGADHLYLSLDLDVLDQAEAPGTSAAGPGGLTLREVLDLVTPLAASPLCTGADIMELSPRWDADGLTARAAARCLLAMVTARWGSA